MRIASPARPLPLERPMPITAVPAPAMTVRTSAKSRLMSPGRAIRSTMPVMPVPSTRSAIANASTMAMFCGAARTSSEFETTTSVSTDCQTRAARRHMRAARKRGVGGEAAAP
jgi:hypothetical protein